MIKRLQLLPIMLLLVVCTACNKPSAADNTAMTTQESLETTTASTLSIAETSVPTRLAVDKIADVGVPVGADAFSSELKADAFADMLFLDGEVWHATTLLTMIPPVGEPIFPCTVLVDRLTVPAEDGECNVSSLIGASVWRSDNCLYTAEELSSNSENTYRGMVYRQWQRGKAVYAGPRFDGTNVMRFEGAFFRRVATETVHANGLVETGMLTLMDIPANKGFVYAGQIVAIGSCAAQIDCGSPIGGLGHNLYASAEYPYLLLAGNDTDGYWVLTSADDIRAIRENEELWRK